MVGTKEAEVDTIPGATVSGTGTSPTDPMVRQFPPLTTEQRVSVRHALVADGFERIGATPDRGDGSYEERWFASSPDGRTYVTLRWAPKI